MGGMERWRLAADEEIPGRFTDPACDEFACVCSNGFEGDLTIGSAFLHKRKRWPKCFPDPDGDAICTNVILRREVANG